MQIARTGSWPAGTTPSGWFAALAERWRTAQAWRAEARALAVMSDAELADMRISRTDVARLMDRTRVPESRA